MQENFISFTGWESDRFVSFSKDLLGRNLVPRVRVVGREPITTTSVDFQGQVVDTVWDGYRRLIVVKTPSGVIYQVGGTNSTRPIASESVIFEMPKEYQDQIISYKDNDIEHLLSDILEKRIAFQDASSFLKFSLRQGELDTQTKGKIIQIATNLCEIGDSVLRKDAAELLGLIESPEVLNTLINLLHDPEPQIRIEVALRFRGLEPVIKNIGESSDLGKSSIEALIEALDDENDEVRIYAAEDLGYFYNDQAIEKLIVKLKTDIHPHVRWACVIALGRTNKLDVAEHFIESLKNDPSIFVQQGAMLSLGRVGSQICKSHPHLVDKLTIILCEKLHTGETATKDYAAYVLGELGVKALECIDGLVEALKPETPFQLKSNVILSLTKLLSHYFSLPKIRTEIQSYLVQNKKIQRPEEWPSSAYYQWFLSGAAELAALLEFHDLAYQYYLSASYEFSAIPWLANYYKGIGFYEAAEEICRENDTVAAREKIIEAIAEFELVKTSDDFKKQSGKTQAGLEFKIILAQARLNMLNAALNWNVLALRKDEFLEVQKYFNDALTFYKRIDLLGLSDTSGKKLSRDEENLVLGLMLFAEIGAELIGLELLSIELNENGLQLALGNLRRKIYRFKDTVKNSRSYALQSFALELISYIDIARETTNTNDSIAERVGEFLEKCKSVFIGSLPTPGNCPIIDFGRASMVVNLNGSMAGDGSKEHPFIFPSGTRLVFEFTVSVAKRTKNDRLIFQAQDAPNGARETYQEIPVHESLYSLRPVDFGSLAPSKAAVQFEFILMFQNQGCSQPIQHLSVWVRIYDPTREYRTSKEQFELRKKSLSDQEEKFSTDLTSLREAASGFKQSPPSDLREKIRQTEAKLGAVREQLRDLLNDQGGG